MNTVNWRPFLVAGVLIVALVILVNVVFSTMWAQTAHGGPYASGPYGPGMMMGAWGGMGFFWIFPIVGFLCMLLFLGVIARLFFGAPSSSPPQRNSLTCGQCGQPLAENWALCPYCGTARLPK